MGNCYVKLISLLRENFDLNQIIEIVKWECTHQIHSVLKIETLLVKIYNNKKALRFRVALNIISYSIQRPKIRSQMKIDAHNWELT